MNIEKVSEGYQCMNCGRRWHYKMDAYAHTEDECKYFIAKSEAMKK